MRNVVSRERTGKTIAERAKNKGIAIEDISRTMGVSQASQGIPPTTLEWWEECPFLF